MFFREVIYRTVMLYLIGFLEQVNVDSGRLYVN